MFYSSLKEKHIFPDDYEVCVRAWNELGMKTFRVFLIWYNNLDVEPFFLEAMEKQSLAYWEKRIDMFKSTKSRPGLAIRWMFRHVPQSTFNNVRRDSDYIIMKEALETSQSICLLDNANRHLHHGIKDNFIEETEYNLSHISRKSSYNIAACNARFKGESVR